MDHDQQVNDKEEVKSNSETNVVTEHKGNTITVQSTKVIGEYNYSFVSVSPTKKAMVDTPMLKKIKVIQANELRTWKGLQVEYISRPGISNLNSSKKYQKTCEYFKLEDERFKIFLEGLLKFKEWEEERLNSVYQFQDQSTKQKEQTLRGSEFLVFKNLKDPTILLKDGPLPLNLYQKSGMAGVASATGGFMDQGGHDLLYKLIKTDGKLLRVILESNGFLQTEAHDWNILWTCQSLKLNQYEGLNENQKINHFPQSYELTRKDRLCANVVQMQEKYGKDEFNIIPDTYILPDEFADFYSHFHKLKSKEQSNLWIIKPQNSSQGKGIYIIDDISEVPIDESCIVSKYITNPLLINNLKFDLRIYVLITSIDPWRIYVYHEGLARFASEPYAVQSSKQNKFAHLTNYSINKKNDKFVQNQNAEQDDVGHKWSLAALSKHLEQIGIDLNLLWSKIYDVIIKSILSVDSIVYNNLKKLPNRNNCFELLGFDILVDSDLKPWLMEVNLSPSLATDSPLDAKIKSQLIIDTFNLVGIKKFDRRRDNLTKMKNRVKNIMRAKSYQSRQTNPQTNMQTKNAYGGKPEDGAENDFFYKNKLLFERISEHSRRNNFIRIYPSKNSDIYDNYFITPRPSNKYLYRYLFCDEIIHFPAGYPAAPNNLTNKNQNSDLDQVLPSSQNDKLSQTGFPQGYQTNMNQISATDFSKAIQNNRTSSAIQKTRPEQVGSKKSLQQMPGATALPGSQGSQLQLQQQDSNKESQKEKLLITGDDVLIEYVARLMIAVKSIKEHHLRPSWKNQVEKFIKHYVWHSSDVRRAENNKLWQRLESRLIEMKERRKRLLKSLYKKENPQHLSQLAGQSKQSTLTHQGILDFEKEYELKEEQKNVIIQGFSAAQLEEMLRTSTKNVAYEVISCLIDSQGKGVLTEIIKWLTTCNQNLLNDQDSILNQLSRKKDVDESDEEPESFIFAPTGKAQGGDNVSQTSVGSASIGSGNSGDIRIKIRKNSMEPHSKLKANHSQLIKQKLQQQEMMKKETEISNFDASSPMLKDKTSILTSSPGPHQKTHSSLIAGSQMDTPQSDILQGLSGTMTKHGQGHHEETKSYHLKVENTTSLYGSPDQKSNRSFQASRGDDFTQSTRFNLQRLDDPDFDFNKQSTNLGSERKRTILDPNQHISLNHALQKSQNVTKTSIFNDNQSIDTSNSKQTLPSKSTSTNETNKVAQLKTYSSQLKSNDGQPSSHLNSAVMAHSNLDSPVKEALNSAYGSYLSNTQFTTNQQTSTLTSQQQQQQPFTQQQSSQQSTAKKVIKVSSSQRKTYSSVKRGQETSNGQEMIGDMKKLQQSKVISKAKQ